MSNMKANGDALFDGEVMRAADEADDSVSVPAPRFIGEFECYGPEGLKWKTSYKNVVTNVGRAYLMNKMFGSTSRAADTWYIGFHKAATASTHLLTDMAGTAEVTGYGANRLSVAFATGASTDTVCSASVSTSVSFTSAGSASITGAFLCASGQATGVSTGILYSEGNFGAVRTVTQSDTIQVTVTVTFGTA